jgi:hypothetical protein
MRILDFGLVALWGVVIFGGVLVWVESLNWLDDRYPLLGWLVKVAAFIAYILAAVFLVDPHLIPAF